jgi:hypothetical protein
VSILRELKCQLSKARSLAHGHRESAAPADHVVDARLGYVTGPDEVDKRQTKVAAGRHALARHPEVDRLAQSAQTPIAIDSARSGTNVRLVQSSEGRAHVAPSRVPVADDRTLEI